MKTIIKTTMTVLAVLLLALPATAYDFMVDGFYYNFTGDGVSVTSEFSAFSLGDYPYKKSIASDVVIPSSVSYLGHQFMVTSIDEGAFYNCFNMTSVTIPNSVTSIGAEAFYNCSGLTSVTIPNSVTSIGNSAFIGCSGLTSVTIPNSVTEIGESAFNGTPWYNNQPDGLVYIGLVAYKYKGNMPEDTSIDIKEGTTSINGYAFYNCRGLTSISIPNSVSSIGSSALSGTSWLNNQPDGLIYAGLIAYCYKGKMQEGTTIELKEGTLGIASSAFYGCSGLTSVIIPNSVTSIGYKAFSGCSSLTSVTIGNSVTSIGYSAFEDCYDLTSVTIPNSVTSIGNYAFFKCSGLTSVTIPNSVTSIGSWAFSCCTGLTSANIGNSVASIGGGAFDGCSGLTKVHINDLGKWCSVKFNGVFGSGCNPLYYAHHLYLNETEIKELIIPNTVKNISSFAFSGCTDLTSVTIPNSVTSIGYEAFSGCTGLTNVQISDLTKWLSIKFSDSSANPLIYSHHLILNGNEVRNLYIPYSVTSINDYAFEGCTGITSVSFDNPITSVGQRAFSGCTGLKRVTIPNSVTSIGDCAFSGCTGLTSVNIPNSVTEIGGGAFSGTPWYDNQSDGLIYAGLVAYRYKGTMPDGTNIVLKDGTLGIAGNAFSDCSGLTSVTIPNSVASIGNYAFSACSGLTSVTIPNSVTYISDHAFYNCAGLTSVTIPNSVTEIGGGAFSGCSGMTSLTIPNSVTLIDRGAFYSCSSLTNVTIPNSVTDIGEEAFDGCSSLTHIFSLNSNPPFAFSNNDIGVFHDVTTSTGTLFVPKGTTEIYKNAITWKDFTNIVEIDNMLMTEKMEIVFGRWAGTMSVGLENTAAISAVQCDMYLPDGVEVVKYDDGDYKVELVAERAASDHTISTTDLSDGGVRVLISSPTSKALKGNEGDLFTIALRVAEDTEIGDYIIPLRNIVLSDTDGKVYYAPDIASTVTVSDYEMGDANGDGRVNVGDYVTTANYILEKNPQPFIFAAADIDGNNIINVGDLVSVANIALHYESAPQMAPATTGAVTLEARMASDDAVSLTLSGASALQFDVTLPQGMTLGEARLAIGDHTAEATPLGGGRWRVLVSSPTSRTLGGDVTLTLLGTGDGDIVIDGAVAATTTGATTAFSPIVLPIGTTGISDLATDNDGDDVIYNLQGQRVTNPTQGIYIKNGKKVIY